MPMDLFPDEKRNSPRYKTEISAKVSTANGNSCQAIIGNVSVSGLQLQGGQDLLNLLLPPLSKHTAANLIMFTLNFNVQTTEQASVPIEIHCVQVYLRRLDKSQFLLGCLFESFDNHCEKALIDHLQNFAQAE